MLSSAAGPLTYDLTVIRGDNALVNAGTLLPVYRATAKMGSAASVLSTDSASESMVALSPTSGPLAVDVSLISKGKPLVAGSYSSILNLVLESSN